ncbi:hypothetical protein [Streptomyces indicus]|uniref:Uncharacterized protein n=1 Tax=Streptomyces indicus TaxID=417292 RepID=A0A1G8U2P5_9ACTN|nr:hypothetical protein [Streptomyces indicus]SDJ47884.1 hypothetical protein SAMN05421806_101593 [Streptomyces indicus]
MNASDQEATAAEDQETATGDPEEERESRRPGMTPRQARRLRIAAASVAMVLVAVVLAVRLASRSSVLVVGVYGLLLVLCGLVIELSRRGRTRLGTYLLAAGLVGALLGDWVLLP